MTLFIVNKVVFPLSVEDFVKKGIVGSASNHENIKMLLIFCCAFKREIIIYPLD